MVGSLADDCRSQDIQLIQAVHKVLGIVFGNFPRGFLFPFGPFHQFVFAFIGVGDKMPHIRDIHDMGYGKAVIFQHPPQKVGEDIGAHVADMSVIIYRGAADVHACLAGNQGHKDFFGTAESIIEFYFHGKNLLEPLL